MAGMTVFHLFAIGAEVGDPLTTQQATAVGATVKLFPPGGKKASTVLAGEGTQTPFPSQTPSRLEEINEMTEVDQRCCKGVKPKDCSK